MPAIPSNLSPVNPHLNSQRQKAGPVEINGMLLFPSTNDEAIQQALNPDSWKKLGARIKVISSKID